MAQNRDIYGGEDPRKVPFYTVPEVAAYVRVPTSTVRSWTKGMSTGAQRKRFQPVIPVRGDLLTFWDLVQVHVLASITREHGVRLPNVRTALAYVKRKMDVRRPLLEQEFETDGVSLFVERLGHLLNVSQDGQLGMRAMFEASLRRIDRDPCGLPIRLFPWTMTPRDVGEPRVIAVDPRLAFGRPTIKDTAIQISVLADRFRAGDAPKRLAREFDLTSTQVEAALRWEMSVAKAA